METQLNRKKHLEDKARRFDTTSLRGTVHGRLIHRDYAAHWFRWGFAERLIMLPDNQHRVLDIGCGVDLPLCKAMVHTHKQTLMPQLYVGTDLNEIKSYPGSAKVKVHAPFDFVADHQQLYDLYGPFTHAVCYEVVEHMAPADALALIKGAYALLADDGTFLLSTPVYDGKAKAKNHIHEFTIPELTGLVQAGGFVVQRRFGTFMNAQEIKKAAPPAYVELVNQLRDYYSWDVLSNFLAPLYPDHSRNNLWVLKKAGHNG